MHSRRLLDRCNLHPDNHIIIMSRAQTTCNGHHQLLSNYTPDNTPQTPAHFSTAQLVSSVVALTCIHSTAMAAKCTAIGLL